VFLVLLNDGIQKMEVNVDYEGIEFTVQGDWIQYERATREEPEHGGHFDGPSVFIGDVDLSDVLDFNILQKIVAQAEVEVSK